MHCSDEHNTSGRTRRGGEVQIRSESAIERVLWAELMNSRKYPKQILTISNFQLDSYLKKFHERNVPAKDFDEKQILALVCILR